MPPIISTFLSCTTILLLFGIKELICFPQVPVVFKDNQKYEGDSCKIGSSGLSGKCKRYDDCIEAINYEKYAGVRPDICEFHAEKAIVCCPEETIQFRSTGGEISAASKQNPE